MAVQGIHSIENGVSFESNHHKFFTDAKIKKVALYSFVAIAVMGTVTLISLSAFGNISWPFALLSIPTILIASWLVYAGREIKDYENPQEIQEMREKARHLSFDDIVKEHGLENIRNYQIVSVEDLQKKFSSSFPGNHFYANSLSKKYPIGTIVKYKLMAVKTLQEQFNSYFQTIDVWQLHSFGGLYELLDLNIITSEQCQKLNKIRQDIGDEIRRDVSNSMAIKSKYPNRQNILLERLDEEIFLERERFHHEKRRLLDLQEDTKREATQLANAHLLRNLDQNPRRDWWSRNVEYTTTIKDGERLALMATHPVIEGLKHTLDRRIEENNTKRTAIIANRTGIEEQKAYDQEKKIAKQEHEANIEKLNAALQELKKTFTVE